MRVKYLNEDKTRGHLQSIAGGLDRIASLQALRGDRDSAIRTRRRLVELSEENPELGSNLRIGSLQSLGELQRLAGQPKDAVESLRKALDQCEQEQLGHKAALVRADLGRLLFDMGESAEARQILDRAREAQEKLFELGERRAWRQTGLADTFTTLGNLHEWGVHGRREALLPAKKAAAIYEEIEAKGGRSDYYQAELARTLNNLGLARAVAGKLVEGQRDVERGKKIRERLLSNQPLIIDRRADLARSYYHSARIQILTRATDKARESIRQAEELYAGIPPKAPEDIYFQACMKALQAGLIEAGKPEGEPERAERQRRADQAMELLKQSVAAGYAYTSRFKKYSPLDSLRSRPDFQDLLRSLGQLSK